jgi:CRP/FNR family nitrogen fixation transcriptional regulator
MGIVIMQAQALASLAPARPAAPRFDAGTADDGFPPIGAAKTFSRDQRVYDEGDAADCVYKVVSGAVRAVRLLADGRRQIADFYLPGDVFGVELGERRRAAVEALGETVLLVARRGLLAARPDHGGGLWRLALRELQRSQDHVLTLGRRSASERVASLLIDLAERLDADRTFDLPMSRQDMADYLGLTIETVSRTLTQLQADGLVALVGTRRVRLPRPAALAELCE